MTAGKTVRFTPLGRDAVRISGRIESPALPADEVLWVDVPEACVGDLTDRLDAWLVWLLPYAFETGQDLILDGPVDASLLEHVQELMEAWSCWRPDRRPIRVTAWPDSAPEPTGTRTGVFFTAGVDSFFSLLHRDEMIRLHPEWRLKPLDDLIYVQGYDIPLAKRAELERKGVALQEVARKTGKTLVLMASNYRDSGVSLRKNAWGPVTHGPAMAASGLLLGRRWHTLLLSASTDYGCLEPWGSTCVTDPFLSTASTRLRHYGAGFERCRKVEFISRFDVVLDHVHVCWRDASERNCGNCEKCLRTLLSIELAGATDRARTFPPGGFSADRLVRAWSEGRPWSANERYRRHYREMRDRAGDLGRIDLVAVIDECLARPVAPMETSR